MSDKAILRNLTEVFGETINKHLPAMVADELKIVLNKASEDQKRVEELSIEVTKYTLLAKELQAENSKLKIELEKLEKTRIDLETREKQLDNKQRDLEIELLKKDLF